MLLQLIRILLIPAKVGRRAASACVVRGGVEFEIVLFGNNPLTSSVFMIQPKSPQHNHRHMHICINSDKSNTNNILTNNIFKEYKLIT